MKKYFTKFLPVEGEIKKSTGFYLDTNIKSTFENQIVEIILIDKWKDEVIAATSKTGCYSKEGFKKLIPLKLFLCSREIEVGDKVIQNGGLKWEDTRCFFKRLPKVDERGHHLEPHDYVIARLREDGTERPNSETFEVEGFWFKIIGEVSPDAVWVKEGDEFQENQLIWQARNINGDVEGLEDWGKKEVLRDDYGYYTIGIECPMCKTFH